MKKIIAALSLIVVSSFASYEIGKSRGINEGLKSAAAVAVVGIQINESQNITTLMGIARHKGVEEMYKWGESWLLSNNESYIENKDNLESILADIDNEEARDTMEALIIPPDLRSVENYLDAYVHTNKVGSASAPGQGN